MDPTAVEIKRDSSGALAGYKLTGTEEKDNDRGSFAAEFFRKNLSD